MHLGYQKLIYTITPLSEERVFRVWDIEGFVLTGKNEKMEKKFESPQGTAQASRVQMGRR